MVLKLGLGVAVGDEHSAKGGRRALHTCHTPFLQLQGQTLGSPQVAFPAPTGTAWSSTAQKATRLGDDPRALAEPLHDVLGALEHLVQAGQRDLWVGGWVGGVWMWWE